MSRAFFLDRSPGETRGVVTLDGAPERLFILRRDDNRRLGLGARLAARVRRVEPALATAFVDLGEGVDGLLPFKPDSRPVEGSLLEVEVRSEARRGKLAVLRVLGAAQGEPRSLSPAPDVARQLADLAGDAVIVEGEAARAAADAAEAESLAQGHRIAGGGMVWIEPTRALTAVDVDLGERKGQDSKRVTRQANLAALSVAARVLRLKGLGGLIVFDLAGRGHDGAALTAAARIAFAPDNPGVALGPISRFGALELTVPRRTRPLADLLCREDGAPSDLTLAHRLIRRLQSEARRQSGARIGASASPAIIEASQPLIPYLADDIGHRFELRPDDRIARDAMEVHAQ
jgi:Ribonuclease G/E